MIEKSLYAAPFCVVILICFDEFLKIHSTIITAAALAGNAEAEE